MLNRHGNTYEFGQNWMTAQQIDHLQRMHLQILKWNCFFSILKLLMFSAKLSWWLITASTWRTVIYCHQEPYFHKSTSRILPQKLFLSRFPALPCAPIHTTWVCLCAVTFDITHNSLRAWNYEIVYIVHKSYALHNKTK